MARMFVEGGAELDVPPHLDGIVAAGYPRRILARVIDSTISGVIYLIFFLLPILLVAQASVAEDEKRVQAIGETGAYLWIVGSVLIMIVGLIQLILLLAKGRTLGMLFLGLRYVRMSDGKIAPLAVIGKSLLEGLCTSFTLGIATIVTWLVSKDEANRHWFSRQTGLITIDARKGRDSALTPPPPAPFPSTPDAVIAGPWRASSEPAYPSPSTPPTPSPGVGAPSPVALTAETAPSPFAPPSPASQMSNAGRGSQATSVPLPGAASDSEPTLARKPEGVLRLSFDDGAEFYLADRVLIGRAPESLDAYPGAELVSIDDPERSISKIHMALTAQSGGAIVEDMYSTNGVSVTFPAGQVQTLTPGSPLVIPVGSTVHFGERMVVISE